LDTDNGTPPCLRNAADVVAAFGTDETSGRSAEAGTAGRAAWRGAGARARRIGSVAIEEAVEFSPLSADFFDDPYETYRWLRDEAPCYHNEQLGFWALSRFDDVVAAHRDWRTFSNERGLRLDQLTDPDGKAAKQNIIFMDPPDHDRMRKLVSRAFTPRAITRMEPIAHGVICEYLDALAEEPSFDAVADFSAPFPIEIISALLGVPKGDRQQIRHWTGLVLHRDPDDPNPTDDGIRALRERGVYFLELIRDKRRNPDDDMIGQLIEAEVADDDGVRHRLTDEEIAEFATLLASAGSETVTKLIGNAVVLFHRHPGEWQKLVADPSRIPNAVEEIVRYWAPSQYQGRFSLADSEWHGVTIPSNQPVFLLTASANRDDREYENPDVFDVDRNFGLSVAFGHGIHVCLGAALARLESRIAIEEWAKRWPSFTVDEARCRKVTMSNVAGYANVPIAVGRG
jgi:cytochrome P450